MAYTPSPRQSSSQNPSSFGPLRHDGNKYTMQYGNVIQTQDATGTPVTSPVTVNTTKTLTVPLNAVAVTIISVTNAIQISEDSTQSTYFSLPAGIPWTFECSDQQLIYLKAGSSTVVSFVFNIV